MLCARLRVAVAVELASHSGWHTTAGLVGRSIVHLGVEKRNTCATHGRLVTHNFMRTFLQRARAQTHHNIYCDDGDDDDDVNNGDDCVFAKAPVWRGAG